MRTYPKKLTKPVRYYWAYGSNLNYAQMSGRCPAADPVKQLYLKPGRLIFRGVADVDLNRKGIIPGGLWKITPACEIALDRYEGAPHLYRKVYFKHDLDGEEVMVLLYKMNSRGVMPPGGPYLEGIARGYRDFGLDTSFLDEALAHSWANKRKTSDMRRRLKRLNGCLAKVDHLYRDVDEGAVHGDEPQPSSSRGDFLPGWSEIAPKTGD